MHGMASVARAACKRVLSATSTALVQRVGKGC